MESRELAEVRRTDLLRILSLASDLGVGLAPEHGLRACYIGLRLAEQLGLSTTERRDLIHVGLLKDAGCTSWTTQIAAMVRGDEIAARRDILFFREFGEKRDVIGWATKFVGAGSPLPVRVGRIADFMVSGRDFMREGFESGGEVACRIAQRLGASDEARIALRSLFEQWNGKGMPRGLRGEAIPVLSRIVFVTSYLEAAHASRGREAAVDLARQRSGSAFDPAVVTAFEQLSQHDEFWRPLEDGSALPFVEGLLPDTTSDGIDEFAACCADFVDMKAYWLAGHSRRVSELAERVARRLRLPDARVREVRIGGLVHDLGLVAVPSFVLNKPVDEQSSAERAAIAAHGDILRRLFERFDALREIGEMASLHHERLDAGTKTADDDALVAAGIIAAANEFDELTHDAPGAPALDPEQAMSVLRSSLAGGPFAAAAAALLEEVSAGGRAVRGRQNWPAGLTDREVDVLRHLASGLSRKAIAGELVVSESTVRSHLEHIYGKLDVSTRVGAVLFAIENGLMP